MSGPKVLDAGRFNRQLSIENLATVADELGGFTEQYVVEGSVWAHICPEQASVQILGEQQTTQITHRILIRFRTGIQCGTRLTTGSRKFEVITAHDVDETRRYLELKVVEQ